MHPLAACRYGFSLISFYSCSPFHLLGWLFSGLSVSALQRMNAGHHHGLLDCVLTPRSVPQFSYIPRLSSRSKTCISDGLGVHEFCSEGPESLGRFGLEPDHIHVDFCPASYICAFYVLVGIGLHPGYMSAFSGRIYLFQVKLGSSTSIRLRHNCVTSFSSVSFPSSLDPPWEAS